MKNLIKLLGIIVIATIIVFTIAACKENCRWCGGSGSCSYSGSSCRDYTCTGCSGNGVCNRCDGTGKVNYFKENF